MNKQEVHPWELPKTKEAQEKIRHFKREVEHTKKEIDMWQKNNNYPSPLRADLALYRIQGVPGYMVGEILDDVFPGVTKDFALKVAEEMRLIAEDSQLIGVDLKPQRYELVQRWAESKGQLKQSKMEKAMSRGEALFASKDVQEAIMIAKREGLITGEGRSLKWNGTRAQIGYFFGCLICGDESEKFRGIANYKRGSGRMIGAKYLEQVFGIEVNKARNDLTKEMKLPGGYEKIDNIIAKARVRAAK